jgi:hypothetical protein
MIEEFGKYCAVFSSSMFKFVLGPVLGAVSDLPVWEASVLTVLGMMTSVIIFSLLGEKIRKVVFKRFYQNRKVFSTKTRKRVRFWRNYGLKGVAFLTPVLFSPIIGTMLASSFGESKTRILTYMLISSVFWAVILSFFFHHAINFLPLQSLIKA